MPVSISRLPVDQQCQLLLGLLLCDFKTFVKCLVGKYEGELIVALRIVDFALAFSAAECDRNAADLDRPGRVNIATGQWALGLFCLACLEELVIGFCRKLR